ncbi:tetratricopeptide repeat protein [Naumannella halotolerans]|nr:tetratricopeptide repeat protein [Naumannella halotolerans]
MSSSSFGGAMDLSALKAKAQAPQSTGAQAGGGSFVVDITQVNFQQVLGESVRYPVVVEFWSPRAEGTAELSRTLADLANSSGGRFLLGRVDVDTEGQIAQALGVQAVPTVVAVLGGQLAPLFQGAQPADQVRAVIDQVLQTAVANGIVGTAPSQGAEAESDEGAEPPADPRFEAADAALAAGDYAAAEAEYAKLLAETPNDPEARAGKAQVGLLARTVGAGIDPQAVIATAEAAPADVEAQLAAADAEIVGGDAAAGFGRLVGVVRRTAGDDRERVRQRLLELFEVVDPKDPAVLKARRDLMTALF